MVRAYTTNQIATFLGRAHPTISQWLDPLSISPESINWPDVFRIFESSNLVEDSTQSLFSFLKIDYAGAILTDRLPNPEGTLLATSLVHLLNLWHQRPLNFVYIDKPMSSGDARDLVAMIANQYYPAKVVFSSRSNVDGVDGAWRVRDRKGWEQIESELFELESEFRQRHGVAKLTE